MDIVSHTLTIGYSLESRNEVRLEVRHDGATDKMYFSRTGALRSNQDTILLGWMIGI